MSRSSGVNGWCWLAKSMAFKSVYLPAPVIANSQIQIADEEHRHLMVSRAAVGEVVELFDGQGKVWRCEIVEVARRLTTARILNERQVPRPTLDLTLGIAMIQRSAFELALEKAVEAGVTRIAPFVAMRSKEARGERRDRWLRIVIESAKQSKHFHLPHIEPVLSYVEVLRLPAVSKIMFAERAGGPLKSALAGAPVLYLIGPEGGWTDDEMTAAASAGFRQAALGANILRAETAAIIGAALIRYELGDI
jgi:16S rRNA (uracil1498-N3)-methyltransferase